MASGQESGRCGASQASGEMVGKSTTWSSGESAGNASFLTVLSGSALCVLEGRVTLRDASVATVGRLPVFQDTPDY